MERWQRPALLWRAALLIALLATGLLAPERAVPAAGGAAPGPKLAALTFDDGPKGSTTQPLLDGLRARGARATFFLIGSQVETEAETVLRIARDGHQIGIHTYDHVSVTGLSRDEFLRQTEDTRRSVYRLLGEQDLWFRPPYGFVDEDAARRADSPVILWSVDPEDWRDGDQRRVQDYLLSHVKDGDIILMHDIYESSVEAALAAVDRLQAQGFQFVTVRELLEARGIAAEPGRLYRCAPAP